MAFICVVAAVAVTVMVFGVVPRVEEIFRDFGTKLPVMTIVLLKFARFCYKGGILSVWGVFFFLPFIPPLFDKQTVEKPRRRFVSRPRLLLILFLLALFGWMIFALFTPVLVLVNSVSGPAGKR